MGLGSFRTAWQRQTKDFGHDQGLKYSCLILDNRGMGDSDKPLARYSTSDMAKDILEVVNYIGWNGKRELHIIGVSMGGMIGQELVKHWDYGKRDFPADSLARDSLFQTELLRYLLFQLQLA